MNLTPEQLRQNAAAMLAAAEGKPVEGRCRAPMSDWHLQSVPIAFNCKDIEYRPKPEPKVRPWRCPADVPGPVCWIRNYLHHSQNWMVICVHSAGIGYIGGGIVGDGRTPSLAWHELGSYEYSTNRINWKPCTVTEEA